MNKQVTIRMAGQRFSMQITTKSLIVLFILLAAAIGFMLLSIAVGSMYIPIPHIVQALMGNADDSTTIVIRELRLPRAIMAAFIGAALAVAGTILQGVIRNPLASPDLLGVTGGASAAAVGFMTLTGGMFSIHWLPVVAIVGAFLTAGLNYVLAWREGVSAHRLVLIGIGISTAMGALTTFLLISGPAHLASQVLGWMTGTIYGVSNTHVLALLPWVVIFLPLAGIFSRDLNVHTMGDSIAAGVGSRVQRSRFILIAISVALAGASVGMAGGISFIGLMAPHMARKLIGPLHGMLIPVSALLGSIILMIADIIGRTFFYPLDIPAGVFTAAIGAPFFLYLLFRSRQ